MNYSRFLCCLALGGVVIGLGGCAKNSQKQEGVAGNLTSEQESINSQAKNYAFQGNSGYTGQVQRNTEGKIKNPLVAPTDQTYYFDLDSNMVNGDDYEALTIQANYLASHPKAIVRLEGSADNRGSREYNIALGWRRDQAVERFLEQHGVMRSQIKEISYGKERPAVLGNNEYAWRLNRKVHLKYEVK